MMKVTFIKFYNDVVTYHYTKMPDTTQFTLMELEMIFVSTVYIYYIVADIILKVIRWHGLRLQTPSTTVYFDTHSSQTSALFVHLIQFVEQPVRVHSK